jgi:hypothetical protein
MKAWNAMRLYKKVLGRSGPRVIIKGIFLVFTGFMEQIKLWFRSVGGSQKDTKKGIDGVGGDEAVGSAARADFCFLSFPR